MSESLFKDVSPENERKILYGIISLPIVNIAIVIESFCVNCEEQGKTTLLLTKIPYFQGSY